jgi:DNA-binding CsgD family transcriptional regulator
MTVRTGGAIATAGVAERRGGRRDEAPTGRERQTPRSRALPEWRYRQKLAPSPSRSPSTPAGSTSAGALSRIPSSLISRVLHPASAPPSGWRRMPLQSSRSAGPRAIVAWPQTPEGEPAAEHVRLPEVLSPAETRVLRYLPTLLSLREIGDELYLSVNTIKVHVRHIYAKLEVHSRRGAAERARALGLL